MTALTAADYERGRTWALTIAAELLRKDGAAAPFHDEGKEHCWASGFRSVGNQPPGTGFATDPGRAQRDIADRIPTARLHARRHLRLVVKIKRKTPGRTAEICARPSILWVPSV